MFEKIVLCAPPRCSCPELHYNREAQNLLLKDDYNGSVLLTFQEMQILIDKFKDIYKVEENE